MAMRRLKTIILTSAPACLWPSALASAQSAERRPSNDLLDSSIEALAGLVVPSASVRRAFFLALLALLTALSAPPAVAQRSEIAVKAAFLPKFARYVQWPGEREQIVLCLIGRDPFGAAVDRAAAQESVRGQPVAVRRMGGVDPNARCDVAWVQGGSNRETASLLAALRNRPVLTVTDSRVGSARGVIHFSVAAGRVRFFIDDAAAADRGLTISSRLLVLALGVRQRRS